MLIPTPYTQSTVNSPSFPWIDYFANIEELFPINKTSTKNQIILLGKNYIM